MKIGRIILGTTLLGVLTWAGGVSAQNQNDRDDRYGYNQGTSVATSQFLEAAAEGGMVEVRLGMIARNRASDPAVRDFADQMVQDHSQANQELRDLAQDKGWPLPSTLDADHRMMIRRMRMLGGDDFDRGYMRAMVRDHQQDVALFRAYAQNGDDPDLRAWARQTLPTLHHQRELAMQTAGTLNAGYRR